MSTNQPYIVSARKYRPSNFQSVVGQRALTATLKNAILSGKLAQAYLFCGPRGVGKTSCARIFAKTINCLNPTADGEACGECESCKAIDKGNSFNLVELDAASNNSVDNIRNISEQVNIPPQEGRYRVFIIDEVHMLSNSAFNAFLKTLEEPPKNVVFILATTERHKVIPTILSRCQVYDFRRITINDIISHLADVAQREGVEADPKALGVIALKADGAMRDALSIFDQVVASTHGNVTYEGTIDALNVLDQDYYFRLMDYFLAGDVASSLLTLKEITDKGFDSQFFINGLADHIRNLMVSADPRTVKLLETSEEMESKYKLQAPKFPVEWYYTAMKILNDADYNYKLSGNKRLLVELTLIRLSRLLGGGFGLKENIPNVINQPSSGAPSASTPRPFEVPGGETPQSVPASNQEASKKTAPSSPSKPATAPRRPTSKPTSFRITAEKPVTPSSSQETLRLTPITEEALSKAWESFIESHPEQRILGSAMRSANPQRVEEGKYRVTVDHPAQKQAFESNITELLEYMKNSLSNDSFTLEVEIAEKGEDDKRMNSKDFLKMVVESNPVLADFLKSVDAELE